MALNVRMNSECWIGKSMKGNRHGLSWGYSSSIYEEDLKKAMKILCLKGQFQYDPQDLLDICSLTATHLTVTFNTVEAIVMCFSTIVMNVDKIWSTLYLLSRDNPTSVISLGIEPIIPIRQESGWGWWSDLVEHRGKERSKPVIDCLSYSMCGWHMTPDQNSFCSCSPGSGAWSYQNYLSQYRVGKPTLICSPSLRKFCARACLRLQKPLEHGSSLVAQIQVCSIVVPFVTIHLLTCSTLLLK